MEALDLSSEAMVSEYRARRALVLRRLDAMGLEAAVPGGAFYVFPSIARFGMDSTAFCTRLLQEAGVAITPGAAFRADDHIRISYCCDTGDLTKGLDRLEYFIRSLEENT